MGAGGARPGSFFGRFRSVPSASFANAIVVLYAVSALLGGIVYLLLPRRHQARLGTRRHWRRSASSTSRSISSPSGWRCCRPIGFAGGGRLPTNRSRARAALTSILAFIVWWGFLIGHVLNNIMGFRLMTSSSVPRFAFAYGTAFAVLYVVALKGLALFTVYPSLGVVLLGTHHSRDVADPAMAFLAPAMYWYGWTATAALGALVFGLIAALLPERWTRRFWPGWLWAIPVFAMIACVYLTLPWFRQQPDDTSLGSMP